MIAGMNLFGITGDGREVREYLLRNGNGIEAGILDYGGIVRTLRVPDAEGAAADIALGFDTLAEYEAKSPYFGAMVGRYANRIGGAAFTLDGRTYTLPANEGPHHIHGGRCGFDRAVWHAEPRSGDGYDGLRLRHRSPDGDEGYPGRLSVTVDYTLNDRNELRIDCEAESDRPTVCNLTHHSYFNLAGHGAGSVLDHELMLCADFFTPTDADSIPTGEVRPVEGTPMDFRAMKTIGRDIEAPDPQLEYAGGYDQNFVLRRHYAGEQVPAARLVHPGSGRVMDVVTSEPGIQLYTGNALEGVEGKGGACYPRRSGICLETQHFPDSPNRPHFPSTTLRPGQVYRSTTLYRFTSRTAR
ncbi:aldose epimerase family protein [Kiritimatiella glycovorans]|uniref:Aldose 1-epimerase n=1 Tax=Kiritimatiella glycovorans TaxID=1307763 RepID=A0A0G3EFF9_9BACT|nr:aldose epimerase family protein [Kiritimatiella glycovorans]AKJ63525.1 Aldose 1-epimerase precursor [Kiritimatiella glycovorans]